MVEFDVMALRKRSLREVWDALPDGYRLRISFFGKCSNYFSDSISESRMLAYSNRIVLCIAAYGRDVFCVLSNLDGVDARMRYVVPTWCY